jgi:hypothetical protein
MYSFDDKQIDTDHLLDDIVECADVTRIEEPPAVRSDLEAEALHTIRVFPCRQQLNIHGSSQVGIGLCADPYVSVVKDKPLLDGEDSKLEPQLVREQIYAFQQ